MSLILDLLFPKKCVSCKKEGSYFCKDCILNIKQGDLICPKCEKLAVGGQTHPICERKYGLDGLWSLGLYKQSFPSPDGERQNPLRAAIQSLKYKYIEDLSKILLDITLEYWIRYQPFVLDQIKKVQGVGWAVAPVPLHWYKENKRGFNQSSLLGKSFAQSLGLDYLDCLKRTRYTKSQTKLRGKDRYQNIKSAFSLDSKFMIHDSEILLIDDVWTTGSTMKECCYVLKRSGAKKVWGITLAR